ncbi:hypothetical protein KY362_04050 [Candidatus Woesearchaeota archaeon]|nr:hypothetical protein [Candidatus Woesearchaeota archaeon]
MIEFPLRGSYQGEQIIRAGVFATLMLLHRGYRAMHFRVTSNNRIGLELVPPGHQSFLYKVMDRGTWTRDTPDVATIRDRARSSYPPFVDGQEESLDDSLWNGDVQAVEHNDRGRCAMTPPPMPVGQTAEAYKLAAAMSVDCEPVEIGDDTRTPYDIVRVVGHFAVSPLESYSSLRVHHWSGDRFRDPQEVLSEYLILEPEKEYRLLAKDRVSEPEDGEEDDSGDDKNGQEWKFELYSENFVERMIQYLVEPDAKNAKNI